MNDISGLSGTGLPSARSLIKATAVALVVAVAVLIVAVLPAEYGVDPTGLGSRLGLVAMSSAAEVQAALVAPERSITAEASSRTDFLSFASCGR